MEYFAFNIITFLPFPFEKWYDRLTNEEEDTMLNSWFLRSGEMEWHFRSQVYK
jgi:hypothetical protein